MKLKAQSKKQRSELALKDMEISNLKKNVKVAKMKEFDSDKDSYIEECHRLRALLEQRFEGVLGILAVNVTPT